MGRPKQETNPAAALALMMLKTEALAAQARMWRAAIEYVDDGRLTVEAAARTLGVSPATYYRKAAPWKPHNSPGVGR